MQARILCFITCATCCVAAIGAREAAAQQPDQQPVREPATIEQAATDQAASQQAAVQPAADRQANARQASGDPGRDAGQEGREAAARPAGNDLSAAQRLGITFGSSYTTEAFGWVRRPAAGSASRYLASFVPEVSVDLSRFRVGLGQVFASAQLLHAGSAAEPMSGTLQTPSSLDAGGFHKLVEAWYADSYFGERLTVKAGWQYADADFGGVEAAATFLNASYGVVPTSPMPQYPDAALGASARVAPMQGVSLGVGVFRKPSSGSLGDGTEVTRARPFTIAELKLEPGWGSAGTYRFGVWQQASARFQAPAGHESIASVDLPSNHGLYATAEHSFHRNADGEPTGLGIFGHWGWAPADRNEIAGYAGAGITYRGWIGARPGDAVGAGLASVSLADGGRETVFELFYQLRLTGQLFVQPDVQIIRRPGGAGPHAVAAGVRMGVEL